MSTQQISFTYCDRCGEPITLCECPIIECTLCHNALNLCTCQRIFAPMTTHQLKIQEMKVRAKKFKEQNAPHLLHPPSKERKHKKESIKQS